MTSLVWITSDRKNPLTVGVVQLCRYAGIFQKDEFFDSAQLRRKSSFGRLNFVLGGDDGARGFFLFFNCRANTAALLFVFSMSVWNGASYYFEVFAKSILII